METTTKKNKLTTAFALSLGWRYFGFGTGHSTGVARKSIGNLGS